MLKRLMALFVFTTIAAAYAGFLPDEVPVPMNPNTTEKANLGSSSASSSVNLPIASAWAISIPTTSSAAPGQLAILHKNNLPAYQSHAANQTVIMIGPDLSKANLIQDQKLVLELLNTAGTIVPYTVMS